LQGVLAHQRLELLWVVVHEFLLVARNVMEWSIGWRLGIRVRAYQKRLRHPAEIG
jgi:hypothetical protein